MLKSLGNALIDFVCATAKIFGWTTGIILAVWFWIDPVHISTVLKTVARNLLPVAILFMITWVVLTTHKKNNNENKG
jgi:hypothetical protein